MPPIVVAFFVLQGLAHGHTVATSGVPTADRTARSKGMGPTPVTYSVTTGPWNGRVADKRGGCDFQLLARVTGRGPMRARINMVEQLLDESWSPRFRIDAGQRATFRVEFIEPYGPEHGYTVAERSTTFTCHKNPKHAGRIEAAQLPEEWR